jgi:hypothetical protein
MKMNLIIKLLIAAAAIAVILVVFLTIDESSNAKIINQPYVGMGDLHRFEAEEYIPGSTPTVKPYYGMGDLRRLENLQETQFPDR